MLRRQLIGGLGAVALLSMASTRAKANPACTPGDKLVFIFMRGGSDGLNMLAPVRDQGYYDKTDYQDKEGSATVWSRRREHGVALEAADVIEFSDPAFSQSSLHATTDQPAYFALNKALAGLVPSIQKDQLAFIHAAGVKTPPRKISHSHFAMMDFIEYGGFMNTGWLARYLATCQASGSESGPESPRLSALAMSRQVQNALNGASGAVTLSDLDDFSLPPDGPVDAAVLGALLDQHADGYSQHGAEVLAMLQRIGEADPSSVELSGSSSFPYPTDANGKLTPLAASLQATARVLCDETLGQELEVVCLEHLGYDSHSDQRSRQDALLQDLGDSVAAFYNDVEPHASVTVVMMSEFGRRIAANNAGGTDHGGGGCMMVLGQGVNGGIYAPGWVQEDGQLLTSMRNQRGDLAVTTDYRTVLSELLTHRMGLACLDTPAQAAALSNIFDGYSHLPEHELGIFQGTLPS